MFDGCHTCAHEFHETVTFLLSSRCFVSGQLGILRFGEHVESQRKLIRVESQSPRTNGIRGELQVAVDRVVRKFLRGGLQVSHGDSAFVVLLNQVDVSVERRDFLGQLHLKEFLHAEHHDVGIDMLMEYAYELLGFCNRESSLSPLKNLTPCASAKCPCTHPASGRALWDRLPIGTGNTLPRPRAGTIRRPARQW